MQAGDVTLQFGGAHMTERPDSEDRFAQASCNCFLIRNETRGDIIPDTYMYSCVCINIFIYRERYIYI